MKTNFCERKNPTTGEEEVCEFFRQVGAYMCCKVWAAGMSLTGHDQCHVTYKQRWIPKNPKAVLAPALPPGHTATLVKGLPGPAPIVHTPLIVKTVLPEGEKHAG
jgi:hypothetical protein